jgi:hypothetical protein
LRAWRRRGEGLDSWDRGLAISGLCCFALSFAIVYGPLMRVIPGLSGMRVPARFYIFVSFTLVWFAARGADDRELLETELHQDGDVILLIKPTQSQPCEAKLFIRDDGQLREVPQATYFAFDRRASNLRPPSSAEPLVKGAGDSAGRTPVQSFRITPFE